MVRWILLTLAGLCVALGMGACSPRSDANETPAATGRREFQVQDGAEAGAEQQRARIKHEAIPGYMAAMTMPFHVRDTNELAGLIPGQEITFTFIVTDDDAWIENIAKTGRAENILPEGAGIRLAREVEPLDVGDLLPDCHLTNQLGQAVSLDDFRGRALVLTFLFTRCPVPTFCPLTAKKLAELQEQLRADAASPTSWHILAVSIDPEYDTPERLRQFGESYGCRPERWSFLTGPLLEITALGEQFGLLFWNADGTVNHNLRTVVVDAGGVIRATIPGNEWEVSRVAEAVVAAAQE